MNTDDTQQQSSDIDAVLKKSGVEILEGVTDTGTSVPNTSSPASQQTDATDGGVARLEKEFAAEFGGTKVPPETGARSSLEENLARLEETKQKLAQEEKELERETQTEIEALKKTKATIEDKIERIKKLEQAEATINAEIEKIKSLEEERLKIEQDIARIQQTISG